VAAAVARSAASDPASTPTDATKAPLRQLRKTMKAKYEGGIFGYSKTMEGTLSFDDTNQRLLFRKDQKELFLFLTMRVTPAFADTQNGSPRRPRILSGVPLIYALPAHFIKRSSLSDSSYSDPDTPGRGDHELSSGQ